MDGADRAEGDGRLPCPMCLVLDVLDGSRPEVADHLRAAGRELGLALRAALDEHGRHGDEGGDDLRRIDLDEAP